MIQVPEEVHAKLVLLLEAVSDAPRCWNGFEAREGFPVKFARVERQLREYETARDLYQARARAPTARVRNCPRSLSGEGVRREVMMVVVKIELWPRGDESKAREIGRAFIANDGTGNTDVGNYKVELKHGGVYYGRPGFWKRGLLTRFRRQVMSPYHLVALAIGACIFSRGSSDRPSAKRQPGLFDGRAGS